MTFVNPQITDSITQTNTTVLGGVPSVAAGNLMQMVSQATGLSMQNAVTNQQQTNMINQASTTQAISQLYSTNTTANGQAIDAINRSTTESKLADSLMIIKALKDLIKSEEPEG